MVLFLLFEYNVPMKITEIYEKYKLPKILQLHLLRTAALAKEICDNWNGSKVDKPEIIQAMLFHDMGNMVKIDLTKGLFDLETEKSIDYWGKIQKEFIDKYGSDDYAANEKIAKELGVSDRVYFLISNMGFRKNYKTVVTEDFSLKICAYSDQRVGPFGVLTLSERLEEANKRYNGNFPNTEGYTSEQLIQFAFENELEIIQYTDIDLNNFDKEVDFLRDYDYQSRTAA